MSNLSNKPQYPIYIISKGRFESCLTAKFLKKDNVPFKLVVEPQEATEYQKRYGYDVVAILPFSNLGQGSIPARNWCWEDSIANGYKRHWILDDNIRYVKRRYKAKRIRCDSGPAFRAIEDFTERYKNIAISGMNYSMFAPDRQKVTPFRVNSHVYSCLLILNQMPKRNESEREIRWRGRYNEDTDLCLQVLARGFCTVQFNVFTIDKMRTMQMKGGNMTELYQGDGRLIMARSLERMWPGIVKVQRRFNRPQHVVDWRKFRTKLIPCKDITLPDDPEFGLKLKQIADIKSDRIKDLLEGAKSADRS